jgi:hypothetical protein
MTPDVARFGTDERTGSDGLPAIQLSTNTSKYYQFAANPAFLVFGNTMH